MAFFSILAIILIAVVRDEPTTFPGLFYAEPSTENGAFALIFEPEMRGLACIVAATCVASMLQPACRAKSGA